MSKTAIVEHVWDQHFDSETNVVNVYINISGARLIGRNGSRCCYDSRRRFFAVREEAR